MTAVYLAATHGKAEVIRVLAELGADLANGGRLVRSAAHGGHVDAIRALVEQGCRIDAADEMGFTPAMCAAVGGHLGSLRVLAELGADMQAIDVWGRTAADIGRGRNHPNGARWLERSVGWQPIHRACDSRQGERLPTLLRAGADPFTPTAAGETPEDICTLNAHTEGALPEDLATTKLLRLALLPWHPERHHLFPRSFQPRVVLVLLLQQRIERRAVQYAELARPRRLTRQMRRLAAALNARASVDIWLNSIVPLFLPRFGALGLG